MLTTNKLVTAALCAGAIAGVASVANAQSLTIGTTVQTCGTQAVVTVSVAGVTDMDAFGFDLSYDSSCADYVSTSSATATSGWTVGGNEISTGTIRVGGFKGGGTAVNGSAEVLQLTFDCGGSPCTSALTATGLVDDLAGASVTNGSLDFQAGTPGSVTLLNEYNYTNDQEGWVFKTATPTFTAPVNLSQPGYLMLASNDDNTLTFGSFDSPANAIVMDAFTPPSGELWQQEGPHYLVRYYIRRTTADATKANVFRLRVNSNNFEDYHILTVNSIPDYSSVPDIFESQAVDLLFQPHPLMYSLPADQQRYYAAFDLINAGTGDDPNGGYIVDKVEVYSLSVDKVEKVSDVKEYTFANATEFDDWESLNYTAYTDIAFSTQTGGGLIMNAPDPDSAFGNWQTKAGAITADATGQSGTLFAKLRYRAEADETSARKVPQMRFRAAPSDFSSVAETGVIDTGSFTFVPSAGNDRYFYTYLKVPAAAQFPIIAAWDLLSFESFADATEQAQNETSAENVYLSNLNIDLVRIADYPAVD
ncbi:MAG: hypothetical protein PWP23_3298 [Candidatus Sumerlaeota bacterium]|nr:hypothetical protein [Candidatus Sumerlaeota bacterium]